MSGPVGGAKFTSPVGAPSTKSNVRPKPFFQVALCCPHHMQMLTGPKTKTMMMTPFHQAQLMLQMPQ
eukprot:2648580-Karenia_brevis.AAC.1